MKVNLKLKFILLFFILFLFSGCSQTIVKYQCGNGSFVDSINSCPVIESQINCPKLDCASCPIKKEIETKNITDTIYVCSDLKEVKNKEDCLNADSEGWYEIKTFTLSSGNSESFTINSNKWRYIASCSSINELGIYNFNMNIVKIENGENNLIQNLLGASCSNEPSYVYGGKGEYFFSDISAINARNWKIKVEAQK